MDFVIGIAAVILGAIMYRFQKLGEPYPHEQTASKTTGEIAKDGVIGGLMGAGVGLIVGYIIGMTFFPVYRFNYVGELDMITWLVLIAVLSWFIGGAIGGLLADRVILENDYPRKRSTLALGGFFTAFAICIATSIFMGIVNTIAIL